MPNLTRDRPAIPTRNWDYQLASEVIPMLQERLEMKIQARQHELVARSWDHEQNVHDVVHSAF